MHWFYIRTFRFLKDIRNWFANSWYYRTLLASSKRGDEYCSVSSMCASGQSKEGVWRERVAEREKKYLLLCDTSNIHTVCRIIDKMLRTKHIDLKHCTLTLQYNSSKFFTYKIAFLEPCVRTRCSLCHRPWRTPHFLKARNKNKGGSLGSFRAVVVVYKEGRGRQHVTSV